VEASTTAAVKSAAPTTVSAAMLGERRNGRTGEHKNDG
jgi:hypothetical protein